MPATFEALAVLMVALLPGALYVWSFERLVGRWGVSLSDRVLRFVGGSAVFHVVFLPFTVSLVRDAAQLSDTEPFRPSTWLKALIYTAVPIAVGSVAGVGTR